MRRSRTETAQPEQISTLNFQSDVPPENRSQSDNNRQPPVRFQLCFFGGPSVIKWICPNLATPRVPQNKPRSCVSESQLSFSLKQTASFSSLWKSLRWISQPANLRPGATGLRVKRCVKVEGRRGRDRRDESGNCTESDQCASTKNQEDGNQELRLRWTSGELLENKKELIPLKCLCQTSEQ